MRRVRRTAKRDGKLLCVVARVHDLMAIERAGSMRGRYFVLGRLLSPLEGIGPEDLPLDRLRARIRDDGVTEVIVATPPSVDGEATALLLKRELGAARRRGDAHRQRRAPRGRPRVRRPDHDGTRPRGPAEAVDSRRHEAGHLDEGRSGRDRPVLAGCARAATSCSSAGRSRSTRRRGSSSTGDIAAQTRRVMENLRAVLAAAGCTLRRRRAHDDLPRRPRRTSPQSTRRTARYFEPPYPARATVQVAALPQRRAGRDRRDRRAAQAEGRSRRRAWGGSRHADVVAEATVKRARRRAGRARADDAVVDAHDRHELADARRDEHLVGAVDVRRARALARQLECRARGPPRGRAPA